MAKKRLFPKLEGTPLENFTPQESVDELQVIDLIEGSGDEVQPNATVRTHYTGALAKTGEIFQSSLDTNNAITFSLNQVIEGWQQGLPGMKIGGKRRILIPADLAYGAHSPAKNIPPNSDLVFDIELIDIK